VHQALVAVQAHHLAQAVAEPVPVALRQVVGGVHVQVDAAGGDFVQVRLPEVRARFLDQRDVGQTLFTQGVAQPGGQLQSAGAATDDDDAVEVGFWAGGGVVGHAEALGKAGAR